MQHHGFILHSRTLDRWPLLPHPNPTLFDTHVHTHTTRVSIRTPIHTRAHAQEPQRVAAKADTATGPRKKSLSRGQLLGTEPVADIKLMKRRKREEKAAAAEAAAVAAARRGEAPPETPAKPSVESGGDCRGCSAPLYALLSSPPLPQTHT